MMQDIAILAIIWLSVFVASYLAHKTRLTPVLWYIFIGTLLVNINLLPQIIPPFIHSFSEPGIIIMFALGFEEDSNNFLSSIKRSWGIALFGAAAPFSVAYYVTWLYWGNANIA